jgi:hypothetical protein
MDTGVVLFLAAIALLVAAGVLARLVLHPPHRWRRWRHLTRPVRRYLHPSKYDRYGRPKASGSDASRTWHKLLSPSTSDRRSSRE